MKNLFSLLLIFVFLISSSFNNKPGKTKKIKTVSGSYISSSEMDVFLKAQMDSFGLPGLSIAIINDSKIVYHRTLGVTNVNTKEKVTNETLFDAGSMAKTPFAYLVMKMVEQGVLSLDQPLYTYLPYPDIAHDERYKLITARMVLSHTSGLPNWRFQNKDGKLNIKFTPGTQVSYSGEGFEYLAKVIAHLKNIPKNNLQQLFEKEVSGPLGMQHAYYTWSDYVAQHQAAGHVDGKVAKGWGISVSKPDFWASYSLQSEAVSYAHFIMGLLEEKGLKKEIFKEMLKAQAADTSRKDNSSWCLGIISRPSAFGNEYLHGGCNLNFSSSFFFNKDQKFGYVFFTNGNKGFDFNKKLEKFLKKEAQ